MLDLVNYEAKTKDAVLMFWNKRNEAKKKQEKAGQRGDWMRKIEPSILVRVDPEQYQEEILSQVLRGVKTLEDANSAIRQTLHSFICASNPYSREKKMLLRDPQGALYWYLKYEDEDMYPPMSWWTLCGVADIWRNSPIYVGDEHAQHTLSMLPVTVGTFTG